MTRDGMTPLALTNGAAPRAPWNRRGIWAPCTFRVGGDCREYSYNLLVALNLYQHETRTVATAA